jgi:tRNA threonylcarbamoyladenosine biosynthesis protein TsaB
MAKILCIETATETCSVAFSVDTTNVLIKEIVEGNMHAQKLTTLICEVLEEAGLSLLSLDAIAVSKGPGSYTGLRVGVSTAKGLCYGASLPLIGINTLQALAANALNQIKDTEKNMLLIPMVDARRMEVYQAIFDCNLNYVEPTTAAIINEDSFQWFLQQNKVYFFGNGAAKCKEVIKHPNAYFIDGIRCSAKHMILLALEAYNKHQTESVAYFEPFYLKDFIATTPRLNS